jgi:phytoene synthase
VAVSGARPAVRRVARDRVEASLDAARVHDPGLRADLEACRRLHALHGRSYYLATWLLPADRRPWVWALYGFFRTADELVDAVPQPDPAELRGWVDATRESWRTGVSDDPSVRALLALRDRFDVDEALVERFCVSMLDDLEVARYTTYADLQGYMAGSARAVGQLMLPVLGTRPGVPCEDADPFAALLGEAFQLTNFVRDVGEDLVRGRLYLPEEDLARCGLTVEDLQVAAATGTVPVGLRELVDLEIARCRQLYRDAEPGIALLDRRVRPGVRAAFELYGSILDRVVAEGYPVLQRRVVVGRRGRARAVAAALSRAG